MSRVRRIYWFVTLVLTIVALDQATKYLAILWLKDHAPIHFWKDLFILQYEENRGAFLSMFAGLPDGIRFYVLTGINSVILVGIGVYLVLRREIEYWASLALMLIFAGGVGNLVDRLFRDGVVVDFMNMGIGYGRFSRTGIFNIADVAIMAGLFVLVAAELVHMWQSRETAPESSE